MPQRIDNLILFATGIASHALRSRIRDRNVRRACAAVVLTVVAIAGGVRSGWRATEWRDGIRLWESLAQLTPSDYRPHSNAATHWIERADYDKAEAALRRALALESRDPAVHANLAVVLLERGDLDAAESIHRSLLASNPNEVNSWLNLGVIELKRNRVSRALEHFEQALSLNPNFEPARIQAESARARIDAARRYMHLRRALARESTDAAFLASYARACRVAGDDECADRHEERARQQRK